MLKPAIIIGLIVSNLGNIIAGLIVSNLGYISQ